MTELRDKIRLAIYIGLQEGDRAIELTDRVLDVLADFEPTDAMLDAGGDRDKLGWDAAPGAVWDAMIEAALPPDEEDWRAEAIHLGI